MEGDLVESLPDGLIVLDADRRIEKVNQRAADLVGHSRPALVGASIDEVLHPRGVDGLAVWRDGWPRSSRLATVRGVPEQVVDVRRADGSDVRLAVTGRYRRDHRGRLTGLTLLLRDPRRRERQASSGIEVVSTVSHELRSPLTSVKGFVSLMLNRWDRLDDVKKREMLEQVNIDAERVTRLVTELLDISRLETGRLKLRRQMVALVPLVGKVVAEVKNLHPELEPEVDVSENLPEVYADPDKIMQVLTNLVENTGKYAGGEGVRVAATAHDGGNFVSVSVSDAGPGIPPEDLPRVFTKFFRSGEGRPTGSGLGLYIAKGIVEAHGGTMTARSTVGEGTTFAFTLPAGVPDSLDAGNAGPSNGEDERT